MVRCTCLKQKQKACTLTTEKLRNEIYAEVKRMMEGKYKSYDELPVMFTPATLAEILGVSKATAYGVVNRPDFPKLRIGKRIIISKKCYLEWIEEQFR